jgi:hypothetical protein
MQYFEAVACPPDIRIPTDDPDAYLWYPAYRWVYNKLLVAESQGLACGPHGLPPPAFPVFSKPIINLRGMGAGSRVLSGRAEYEQHQAPGHLWMTLLEGEHVSSDVAVQSGAAVWFRHAMGVPSGAGTFDYWVIEADGRRTLEAYVGQWIEKHLRSYTGMINVETIGGRIIELHLRFSDQWPDLYGPRWLPAVVGLYSRGEWNLEERERRTGYSVALFGPHGLAYRHPPAALVQEVRDMPSVTSVQITFHEDRPPAAHSMPPGGFRLAIVNCLDLELGRLARARLAAALAPHRDVI